MVYLLYTPGVFKLTWKLIRVMLNEKTVAKVKFVSDDKLQDTLLSAIDKSVLVDIYGGDRPWKSVPCPNNVDGESVQEYDEAACKKSGIYFE